MTLSAENGPSLSKADFDAVFNSLRRWGGAAGGADERGTLATVTPEMTLEALRVPRTGRRVSLSLPLNRTSGPDNARPALHHMVDLGDVEEPEPSAHKDFIGLDYHGKAVSHLDAVCHIGYRGELFGGVPASKAFSSLGSDWAAVTSLAGGLVLRGVLIDMPRVAGVPWLEPGTAVHDADIRRAEDRLGFAVRAGDLVVLRTGHHARKAAVGAWNPDNASAGLHVDAMPLLAERGAVALGGDGDSDVRPSPVAGVHSPVHALALTALGMPLLDNLDLEELSVACAEAGRYEFLTIVAPLVVPRGTGSPVNPVAVL
jgi:hypothetical protein